MRGVWGGPAEPATPSDKRPDAAAPNSGPAGGEHPYPDAVPTPDDKQPDRARLILLPTSSRAKRRKSFTVHVGPAGSVTLASRDNHAAGTHRPATLRVGTRGSVLRIGTGNRAGAAREDRAADVSGTGGPRPAAAPTSPPIPPE